MNIVDCVYPLTRLGVKIFPLRAKTKDGHLLKSWKEASCYSDTIDQWSSRWPGCNWGVACGELGHQDTTSTAKLPQLLVLDCDGQSAYEWFASKYPQLCGCVVRTGRDGGGAHVYLWAPHDCELTIATHIELPSGAPDDVVIDVRCNGGYVVAPGSIHPSGRRYEWAPGCVDEDGELAIMDAPAEWFDGRDAKHLLVGVPAATPVPAPAPAPAKTTHTPASAPAADEESIHTRWLRYYDSAVEQIADEVAKCDDGDGHPVVWRAACRLYELTQPWQDDPSCLLLDAVSRWTFRKNGRSRRTVMADVVKACADAQKRVTPVDPVETLRRDEDAKISFDPAQVEALSQACAAKQKPADSAATPPSATPAGDVPGVTWSKNKNGERCCKKTCSNLTAILDGDRRLGCLAYDDATDRIVWRDAPAEHPEWAGAALRDCDLVWLCSMIEQYYGTTWSFVYVQQVLSLVAQSRSYNSFLESITAPWDGVDRLEHGAARYFGTDDTLYSNEALRRWLIGLMARQFATAARPVKMDYVLLLQGPQGCGKTSGLETLAGTRHFATSPLEPGNKDCTMILHSASVVVYDELGGRQRRDLEAIKNHITTSTDKYRRPYGLVVGEQPRRCAMAATTNDDTPLYDATGNRRWLILRCGRIDVRAIEKDRTQILAQALAEYQAWMRGDAGARPWWFRPGVDDELIAAATQKQNEATSTDEIESEVLAYVSTAFAQHEKLSIKDIIDAVFRPDSTEKTIALTSRYSREISKILKVRCGLECVHTKLGNRWQRKEQQ